MQRFEDAVNESVTVTLSQNQFDTLVSFSFNVGRGAFQNSTLLKKLNHGMYDEVPIQLKRWVFAGGQRVRGLEVRRENEIKLWNGEDRRSKKIGFCYPRSSIFYPRIFTMLETG